MFGLVSFFTLSQCLIINKHKKKHDISETITVPLKTHTMTFLYKQNQITTASVKDFIQISSNATESLGSTVKTISITVTDPVRGEWAQTKLQAETDFTERPIQKITVWGKSGPEESVQGLVVFLDVCVVPGFGASVDLNASLPHRGLLRNTTDVERESSTHMHRL